MFLNVLIPRSDGEGLEFENESLQIICIRKIFRFCFFPFVLGIEPKVLCYTTKGTFKFQSEQGEDSIDQ